ncbi:MAG: sulfite exporter TauE/SafE family protein [Bdellovibrionales bacterium]|nr:sulfite exporter TauE/SafE family protein [Bdellovibrionales bacterium]
MVFVLLTALLASGLTFFSGFGLGTILMPAMALFFPLPDAVALTAVVHLLNNVFKWTLVRPSVDRAVFIRFALPAVPAAFLGAWLLGRMAGMREVGSWALGDRVFHVEVMPLCMACLMVFFAAMDLLPGLKAWAVDRRYLFLGGMLSGFFGGLSGHQGALRSVFLLRSGLSKESFVATGVAAACFVDLARLVQYARQAAKLDMIQHGPLLGGATLAAFAGAWLGNRFLPKVTLQGIQVLVALLLLVIALLLGAGVHS